MAPGNKGPPLGWICTRRRNRYKEPTEGYLLGGRFLPLSGTSSSPRVPMGPTYAALARTLLAIAMVYKGWQWQAEAQNSSIVCGESIERAS
uniref:Uncharacterized protein n=1 Tax=Vespula pensylvanica TaxID=30213 RepID=A0A834UD61_VESPE|nr:hypothetical protein H0235_005109 [Vespula pensylvanica]